MLYEGVLGVYRYQSEQICFVYWRYKQFETTYG